MGDKGNEWFDHSFEQVGCEEIAKKSLFNRKISLKSVIIFSKFLLHWQAFNSFDLSRNRQQRKKRKLFA